MSIAIIFISNFISRQRWKKQLLSLVGHVYVPARVSHRNRNQKAGVISDVILAAHTVTNVRKDLQSVRFYPA